MYATPQRYSHSLTDNNFIINHTNNNNQDMSILSEKFNQICLARPTPYMVPRLSKSRAQHQRSIAQHTTLAAPYITSRTKVNRPAYNLGRTIHNITHSITYSHIIKPDQFITTYISQLPSSITHQYISIKCNLILGSHIITNMETLSSVSTIHSTSVDSWRGVPIPVSGSKSR